ncbi:ribonuclease H-like domain-containing protein [Tanacetum coccineum]
MADFHHLDDARDIWLAVKARFGGNKESKKMRKSMLKQEFQEFKVAITLKAKGGLDYLNFDDLYNKLKSHEIDIKGGSSYKSNHNASPSHSAFVSTTSANNKMSYAAPLKQSSSYTTASPGFNVSQFNSGNIVEDVLHSFVAESDPQQQIIYEDFDQIGKLDLEELDIKWQMAMLSVIINRFEKKAGKKMKFNNRDAARFDKKKVRCYKCSQLGHFARECTGKQGESNARYSAFKLKELEQDKSTEPKALLSVDLMVNWSDHEESTDENASQVYGMIDGCDDEDEVACEFALMGVTSQTKLDNTLARFAKWEESSKNLAKLVDSTMSVKTKLGLGYGDYIGEDEVYYLTMPSIFDPTLEEVDGNPTPVSDKSSEPKTNDFASCDSSDKSSSPKSVESSVFSTRVAESASKSKTAAQEDISFNNNTPSVSSFKDDKHSSFGCNKNNLRHRVKNKVSGFKSCFVCGSFSHLIKDCDFYENKMGVYSVQMESRPMWNNVDNIPLFVPQAAHGRSGKVAFPTGYVNVPTPIPAGRQTRPAPVYAGTPVPAGRQNRPAPIHAGRPFPTSRRNSPSVSAGWRRNAARSMSRPTNSYFQNASRPISFDQMYMGKGKWKLLLSPQQVVLGEIIDHICKGDPRTMVDLNNLHGLTLIDPLGRLKSEMA